MTTLNTIAEDLAFSYGDQFNDALKESIKNSIIDYRALLIRPDIENNFINAQHYLQSFCVQMITTDSSECIGLTVGKTILVSKETLPKTVRLKGMSYSFIGSVDRFITYVHSTKQNLVNREALPFQRPNQIYYSIINNRLYLLNTVRLCKVLLEGIIEDPRDIEDCNNPNMFSDDIPFSCPADMIAKIKEIIKRQYPVQLIKDGKEVNIDTDDND
jgi:hypothetical protein